MFVDFTYLRTYDSSILQNLYKAWNQPPQLDGWNLQSGADPCEESWKGITCCGSSVISIQLNGLELNGTLNGNLFDLLNLKQFKTAYFDYFGYMDLSCNHIHGEIPSSLPPNNLKVLKLGSSYIYFQLCGNLSFNNFTQEATFSLKPMRYLEHLNLSHNSLSCSLGNMFMGFPNLKQMDLSYNRFTVDLPNSFASLSNLTGLYLQRNRFTGSPSVVEDLPLHHLSIQWNRMSGEIPEKLFNIPKLRIYGYNRKICARRNIMIYMYIIERYRHGNKDIEPHLPISLNFIFLCI
ncbi:hypothetical protein MKW92_050545 [Papaver armeniacum]|nr:hypothetical protein MKW92_050545 [Papaver armeniacum]